MRSELHQLASISSGFKRTPAPMERRRPDFLAGVERAADRELFFSALAATPEISGDFSATLRLAHEATRRPNCAVDSFDDGVALAQIYLQRGDASNARLFWHDAFNAAARCDAWDVIYSKGTRLFRARIEKEPLANTLMHLELTKFLREMAIDLRQAAIRLQGAFDRDALAVEQGFVGYSADRRLGTYFISDCLGVAVRERNSHQTLVAHIDDWVAERSLETMLLRLPVGELEARIVGVHSHDPASLRKVAALIRYFQVRDVKVISSDILRSDWVPSFVVDPETFQIVDHVPGKEGPHAWFTAPLCWHSRAGKPLRLAFDLPRNIESMPVYVDQLQATKMVVAYTDKNYFQIARQCFNNRRLELAQMPFEVEGAAQIYDAICASNEPFIAGAQQRIEELRSLGVECGDAILEEAYSQLVTAPKYVGVGADAMNAEWIRAARNSYIVIEHGKAVLRPGVLGWRALED